MGSSDTIVVSSVAPVSPPLIRLPASTRRSEIRPEIGARTSVHSRLSEACFRAASDEATAPAASRAVDRRVSNSRSVKVWLRTSGVARSRSSDAISNLARARSRSALACSTAMRYGRGSTTKRRSPCLTTSPSLKWMESMKPETRARTSTVSTAVNRPVYSSHSVIVFWSGRATVTGGGEAAVSAGLRSQPAKPCAARTSRPNETPRTISPPSQEDRQATHCSSKSQRPPPPGREHETPSGRAFSAIRREEYSSLT